MKLPHDSEIKVDEQITSIVAPRVAEALEQTQISRYHFPGGHGFAAEDANHFADLVRGRQSEITGRCNELNGPDRIIGAVRIQSKYFRTPVETVASSFDSTKGGYRYTGQQLEVPFDQYEACVELMRCRIRRGQVPGVTDTADAEKIIRKGTITYRQARNIARAGNIDSIVFDARTQSATSGGIFAMSFVITFASNIWAGETKHKAAKNAIVSGLVAGSTTFVTGIITAQLLRTKTAAAAHVSIHSGIRLVSTTTFGRGVIHQVARGSLRKAVHGAAAVNHLSKLVRTNAIAGCVATVVVAAPDFYRAAFDHSISWKQFSKNLAISSAGVVSGTVGWLGGAAAGAAIGSSIPFVGTAVGAVVGAVAGALTGGAGATVGTKMLADRIIADDSERLLHVVQSGMELLAWEFLLTQAEVTEVGLLAKQKITVDWLRRMYKEGSHQHSDEKFHAFVRRELEPFYDEVVNRRAKIELPSSEDVETELLRIRSSADAYLSV